MALIYDLVNIAELQGFVRDLQLDMDRNRFVLSNYLPNAQVDSIEFRMTVGTLLDQDAATLRPWDTPSPIGKRQGSRRLIGELAPISRKIPLGEEEDLRVRAMQSGGATTDAIVGAVYNDAANMARAVVSRIEMLRGKALFDAQLVIAENGLTQTVDFGRNATHSVTAGILWSVANAATAVPITDLRGWMQTYIADNGVVPAFILASSDVLNGLLVNNQFRTLAATAAGAPALVTVDTVQQVLQAFGMPPIVTYDVNTRVNGTATRVTPANQILLMPPADEPLGRTLLGPTAEALEIAEARLIAIDETPGLAATVWKEMDPVKTWTKATAVGLPFIANPDLTFRATVQ